MSVLDTVLGVVGEPSNTFDPIAAYGYNITQNINKRDIAIGRDEDLSRIIQILIRNTENNPLLVGDPGVGKSAIVSALAEGIAQRTVPGMLHGKQIVELDMSKVSSNARTKVEIEKNVRSFIEAVAKRDDIIIFLRSLTRLKDGMP